MKPTTRILLAAAALLLGVAYVAPLWHIGLVRRSTPKGSGCSCGSTRSRGRSRTICKHQRPEPLHRHEGDRARRIPELRLMPGIVATLIGAGLVVAGIGRRGLLYAWTALLTVIAAAGLVDFWIWGYDYGHDLDPTAAIKIPGLSYQPPLLGSKQLLNFTAISWPSLGGWAIAAALTTGLVLCVLEYRRRPLSEALRRAA